MLKKVFIVAIVFFVIALCIAGYFIFFRDKTPDEQIPGDQNYFPFGPDANTQTPATTTTPSTNTDVQPSTISITNPVVLLSNIPTTPGIALTRGNTTLVRFVERAQGHIKEVNLQSGTTSVVSITTLPKIQETVWLNAGNSLIFRYIGENEEVRTYKADVTTKNSSTGYGTLDGTFLASNIEQVVASPDLKKLFFLEKDTEGVRGIVSAYDGSKRKEIFSSAISEWIVTWPEANTIILTTKASNNNLGYTYSINATTGSMKKLLGPRSALTSLSNPTVTYVAYTDSLSTLYIYNVKTGVSIPTNMVTFVDKCVWSKKNKLYCAVPHTPIGGALPDVWYQGLAGYNDTLYEIDPVSGSALAIDEYKNITRLNMDVSSISLSSKEDYLLITNRYDGTLWSVNLAL